MATDTRLKETLPELTERIVQTYTDIAQINHDRASHQLSKLGDIERAELLPFGNDDKCVGIFGAQIGIFAILDIAQDLAGVLHPDSWSLPRLAWLVMAALVLMIGSFIVLAQWGGSPPGSTYVPAHMEDGRFVPGGTK